MTHTSALDHAVHAAVHTSTPHADAADIRPIKWAADGTPTIYRAVVSVSWIADAADPVAALDAAMAGLRAAMGSAR